MYKKGGMCCPTLDCELHPKSWTQNFWGAVQGADAFISRTE